MAGLDKAAAQFAAAFDAHAFKAGKVLGFGVFMPQGAQVLFKGVEFVGAERALWAGAFPKDGFGELGA